MSGIFGMYHTDGQPAERRLVRHAVESMAHRGPDGMTAWAQGPAGLGHALFQTTPESRYDRQPLVHESDRFVLVADARIDNRGELASHFSFRQPLAQVPDSAFIMAAYDKWGPACPEHLLGDFAFGIWDRTDRTLFCARDPMGMRPLFYIQDGNTTAFASEVPPLTALCDQPHRIAERSIALYLSRAYEEAPPATFLEVVSQLPGGHAALFSGREKRIWRYWTVDPQKTVRHASDADYAAAFRDLFLSAVECRLRSTTPVGTFLSGGLDSSAVTCSARSLLAEGEGGALHSFSAVWPDLAEQEGEAIDERQYMETVGALKGIEPHYCNLEAVSALAGADRAVEALGRPLYAANTHINWKIAQAANEQGIRVLLDGLDGDSVVTHGMHRLWLLLRRGEWDALEDEIGRYATHHGGDPTKTFDQYVVSRLSELARSGELMLFLQRVSEFRTRRAYSLYDLYVRSGVKHQLSTALRQWWGRAGRPRRARDEKANPHSAILPDRLRLLIDESKPVRSLPVGSESDIRRAHWGELKGGLWTLALEAVNSMGAHNQVEMRSPFFDRRLIEFCIALPLEQKFKQGWTRYVLRRAVNGFMPESVQWRPGKANISAAFLKGLRDGASERMQALQRPGRVSPYVCEPVLQRSIERIQAAQHHHEADSELDQLISVLLLDMWLERVQSPR
jgi:asparagine synthase (glutamine-hydrolysing)